MASPEVLNIADLLQPISEAEPAGVDLRADTTPGSLYYQIKDARNVARAAERKAAADAGDPEGGEKPVKPDWRPVLRLSQKALVEKAKDLELAAYLVEALVRLHGFPGLRDGFRLAHGLVENFWNNLHPRPDEDGVATLVGPISGLNGVDNEGALIAPIAKVPLTASANGSYATSHYHQALALSQVSDELHRQRQVEQGAATLKTIEQAATDTEDKFFIELLDDLTQCRQQYESLCQALDTRCGTHAPPSSNIRSALDACREAVMYLGRGKLPVTNVEGDATNANSGALVISASGPVTGGGTIRTREDAFKMLLKVAEYFRHTEPHTPVSYALEQAVRWGRMGLPDLLMDLIADEGTRQALFHRVGIRPPNTDGQ